MKTQIILIVMLLFGASLAGAANNPIEVIDTQITCVDWSPYIEGSEVPSLGLDGTFTLAYNVPDASTINVEQNWYDHNNQWIGGVTFWPEAVQGSGQIQLEAYGGGPVPLQFPFSVAFRIDLYTLYDDGDYALHTIQFTATCLGYGSAQITFSGNNEADPFFNPNDGRIHADAAAPFAVYCIEPGLQVYGVNDDGQGWLAFTVDSEAMNADAPDENTVIAEAGNIRLYQLTSGDFQINAGPDAEGKVYVLTWNGCPVEYSSAGTLDPFSGETVPMDTRQY